MGRQAKIKKKRIEKYVKEHNQKFDRAGHGVDVHIPSDTEQFDQKAKEASVEHNSPERIEFQNKMNETIERYKSFGMFYVGNEEAGFGPLKLLLQEHIQSVVNQAGLSAIIMLLREKLEKLGISLPQHEIDAKIVENLEANLFEIQAQFGIIITPREVAAMKRE